MCIVQENRKFRSVPGEEKLYLALVTGRYTIQKLALLYHSPSGSFLARSHHNRCDLQNEFFIRQVRTYAWAEIIEFFSMCKISWYRRRDDKNYKDFDQWLRNMQGVLESVSAPEQVRKQVAALRSN
jgi:hypothetical protein